MSTRRTDRRGFTLIELLMVAVVGSLILMALYEVLATNQRTFTAQSASSQVQQTLRAGSSVLYSELREVSPAENDIVSMSSTSMTVRAMRGFGYVCDTPTAPASSVTLTVRKVGRYLQDGDSVVVFKDNSPSTRNDDQWDAGPVTAITEDVRCPSSTTDTAQDVTLGDVAYGAPPDSILDGAPVRAFTHYTYRLGQMDGEWFLLRDDEDGMTEPLVGPVDDSDGIRFSYLDAGGNTTTDPAAVREIEVTIRRTTEATDPDGNPVGDSLTLRVFPRN